MKKVLLIVFITVFGLAASAQTNFGIQAGGLLSKVNDKNMSEENRALLGDGKWKPGFKIGFFAEVPMADKIYFNPELNYVNKGFKYKNTINEGSVTGDADASGTTHFLEVPLNFLYKVNGDAGGFFFGAGPSVGMGLSGKTRIKAQGTVDGEPQESIDESSGIKFDGKDDAMDDDLHLKRFEFGLNAFVGYELSNGLRFTLQARPDFSNLSAYEEEDEAAFNTYKNTYFGINIGYRF